MQIPSLESRVASLEAVQAQINERLGNIEQGQRDLAKSVEQGFAEVRHNARSDFRWLLGILISTQLTTLITLGTLILVKLG